MDLSHLHGSRVVVTGGAGFLGSHLCDRLVAAGAHVTCIDNLITGKAENVSHLVGERFTLVHYDVTNFLHVPGPVDFILHFASPASPVDYLRWPIQTLKVGSLGTHKALGLAKEKGARFLLASTSEVYGDPQVSPQPESYWGHVNPVGPRGVYDEAKRFAEALTLAYHRQHDVDVRIVRIFNSILADEQVLYDDGQQLRRESAETLARRLGSQVDLTGYSVPAFNNEGRIEAAAATAFVGHRSAARCFEVRTSYGRSIRVTGDHSLFVEGSGGTPEARAVSELTVGDRIAVAGRCEVPERDRREISLIEMWDSLGIDPWGLVIRAPELGDVVWEHRTAILDALLPRRSSPRRSVWGQVHRYRSANELPLALFRKLGIPLPVGPEVVVRKTRSKVVLAERIAVTDELLWLLGLYVAEGTRDEALRKRATKVLERDLGVRDVRAHSPLLRLLWEHLGFPPDNTKLIPGWILGLPLARLKWFLEGYREGDGVHSGHTFAEAQRHEFSTVSPELKDDLIVALARFGLCPSVGRYTTTFKQRTGERRYPFWRLTLAHVTPWSPLEWDEGVTQSMSARRTGDLVWAAVTDIEEVEPTEKVYDFCVPGLENFWAGTGVMAHNTYGPRMRVDDGRAVPAFFSAALRGEPLPVFGDGSQTRSLCYVDDEVEGILRLLCSDHVGPVNVGNPEEVTILQLAEAVQDAVGSHPGVALHPAPEDDPKVRRPDTRLAEQLLGWKAEVPLREGLARTVDWFRAELG